MSRESTIDPDVPADNVKVDKADLRANFQAAKDEIDDLYRYTGMAWQLANNLIRMGTL